ncbi:MAG: class I SAM-dependent methyltransferase [Synechococcus sp.]
MALARLVAAARRPLTVLLLTAAERQKLDPSDDALFYAQPRFVHHLDAAFRARLTQLYRERIPPGAVVLDLMSSWVSHLPPEGRYGEVIGHGLNARELEANPRLDRHWVQNLNQEQGLPLAEASVDRALIVAGWQSLQAPEAVAAELRRVVRPGGELIVSFSNRMFPQKAARIWMEGSDTDHLAYVRRVLEAQGWAVPLEIQETTRAAGPLGWIGAQGDPFLAVVALRPA